MWATVNYMAVLSATVASIVIGSIWFGPLFGKKFAAAMGMDKCTPEQMAAMKKKMWMSYLMQFIASLVMFYVLAGIIVGLGQLGLVNGVLSGLVMWLGFVLPLKIGDVAWGGNKTLFWLTSMNMLVTLLAAGAIIGFWY